MRKDLDAWTDDLADTAQRVLDGEIKPAAANVVIRAADAVTRICKLKLEAYKMIGGQPDAASLKLIGVQTKAS